MSARSAVVLSCLVACGVGAPNPAWAFPPDLFFNTDVVSIQITGQGAVPFGEAKALVDTTISINKAQDHNSSRSNKTASIVQPPDPDDTDDVDPDSVDGLPFDLFSTLAITQLDFSFVSNDPVGNFAEEFGSGPSALLEDIDLEIVQPASFEFDKTAPDFGMLAVGTMGKAQTYRGHVTVLKAAVSGDGGASVGELDVFMDSFVISGVEGSDAYKLLPDGRTLQHQFDILLDFTASYEGVEFTILGMQGTVIEEGQLLNTVVPEPSSIALFVAGVAVVVGRRRWLQKAR